MGVITDNCRHSWLSYSSWSSSTDRPSCTTLMLAPVCIAVQRLGLDCDLQHLDMPTVMFHIGETHYALQYMLRPPQAWTKIKQHN